MSRDEYVELVQALMSRNPDRVRDANRRLFEAVVESSGKPGENDHRREADLVLAEIAN